jgi:hypothetical protein
MSGKHVSAAIKCGLFKGDTYAALLILCHKASTGTAFKSGKAIPEGEIPRFTDKQFMKDLRIPYRRESPRQIRKKLVKSGVVVATRVPNSFKGRNTFPVYSYYVSLERLLELGPKPKKSRGKAIGEPVASSSATKSAAPQEVLHTDTQKTLHTETLYAAKSAAQSGNPTDYSLGAASAQIPFAEDSTVGGSAPQAATPSQRSTSQRRWRSHRCTLHRESWNRERTAERPVTVWIRSGCKHRDREPYRGQTRTRFTD